MQGFVSSTVGRPLGDFVYFSLVGPAVGLIHEDGSKAFPGCLSSSSTKSSRSRGSRTSLETVANPNPPRYLLYRGALYSRYLGG